MTTKKTTLRELVKDTAEQRLGIPFDSLTDIQRSRELVRFYTTKVLANLAPALLPEDEQDMEACYVDATRDLGVDFLARVGTHVLIIQAKYHGKNKIEDPQEFSHFCEVINRLHPETGKALQKNALLQELLDEIDWDTDTFSLQFISLARANPEIRVRENQGPTVDLSIRSLEDRTEVEFLDEQNLNERLREAISAADAIREPVDVRLSAEAGQPAWLTYQNSDGRLAYLGRINAKQIFEIYKQHRQRLFAMNIRNYIGDTSTNKGIVATARNAPADFFFFNNGLAMAATKITPHAEGNILRCEQLSIINGAQTVRSLFKAFQKVPAKAGDAEVLIRLTEISLSPKPREADFLDSVTRFNNTQNVVKVSDFRSNDFVQRSLAAHFARLKRTGKFFSYRNKRTSRDDAGKISIPLEEFTKTVHAFQYGPADVFGGTSYLFDTGIQGGYLKLFGEDGEIPIALTRERFLSFSGVWFICEVVRDLWDLERQKQEKAEALLVEKMQQEGSVLLPVARHALERRWTIFFTVGELLRTRYALGNRPLNDDIMAAGDPKWTESETGPRKALAKYT